MRATKFTPLKEVQPSTEGTDSKETSYPLAWAPAYYLSSSFSACPAERQKERESGREREREREREKNNEQKREKI